MLLTRKHTKLALALLLCLISFLVAASYYYFNVMEHLVYQRRDPETGIIMRATCKWNGVATYVTYITVLTPREEVEISKVALCCGGDILSDCTEGNGGVTGLILDRTRKALLVEFVGRQSIEVPLLDAYISKP